MPDPVKALLQMLDWRRRDGDWAFKARDAISRKNRKANKKSFPARVRTISKRSCPQLSASEGSDLRERSKRSCLRSRMICSMPCWGRPGVRVESASSNLRRSSRKKPLKTGNLARIQSGSERLLAGSNERRQS